MTNNFKWDFYKDKRGEWHWKRTTPSGEIIHVSTEGFINKHDCKNNARRNGYLR